MVDANTEQLAYSLLTGAYRLGRILGKGGMGIVFEGTRVTDRAPVAIKCLHPRLATEPTSVERFQREAQAAGAIGHQENICPVIDFGITEAGIPYLVMPLLDGSSLEALFQSRLLTLERLVDIVLQVLAGLQAAAQAGVVHRDLKPGNIFVTRGAGDRDLVKILDFGISKIVGRKEVQKLTRTGAVLGTPHYMSPEQASGAADVDHRTDIYAVGTLFYEGLTGRCPYEGDSYNEIIARIVSAPFAMPRRLNPWIPAAVEQVVLTAMAKDAAARYATAGEMAEALRAALLDTDAEAGSGPGTASATTAIGEEGGFGPSSQPRGTPFAPEPHGAASTLAIDGAAGRRPVKRLAWAAVLLLLIASSLGVALLRTASEPTTSAVEPISAVPLLPAAEPIAETGSVSPRALDFPEVTIPVEDDEGEPSETPSGRRKRAERPSSNKQQQVTVTGMSGPLDRPAEETPSVSAAPAPVPATGEADTAPEPGIIKRGMTFEDRYE